MIWLTVFENSENETCQQCLYRDLPDDEVAEAVATGNENGLYISSVSYAEKGWLLVMDSCTHFTQQIFRISSQTLPVEWIYEKKERGFFVSAIALDASDPRSPDTCRSLVVMSKGTPYTDQDYEISTRFPFGWFFRKQRENFSVTAVAAAQHFSGPPTWVVVASRGAPFTDQWIESGSEYPEDCVNAKSREGFRIIAAASTREEIAVVLSRSHRQEVPETRALLTAPYPSREIDRSWNINDRIAVIIRAPRSKPRPPPQQEQPQPSLQRAPSRRDPATGVLSCGICMEPMGTGQERNISNGTCGHAYCEECLSTAVRMSGECPACRTPLQVSDLRRVYI